MKNIVPLVLTLVCAHVLAGPGEIESMPKDAQERLQFELSKRLGNRLEVAGVNSRVTDDVRALRDIQIVNKIEAELDLIKSMKPFTEGLKLTPESLVQLEATTAARIDLHQIAVSNVPDDKIQEVANVTKSELRLMSSKANLDMALVEKLSAAFSRNRLQGVQLYNPLTPNDSNQANVTVPGHFDSKTGRLTQEYPRRRFNIVGVLADISTSPYTHICSGTLIADKWFLTATHCLRDPLTSTRFAVQRLGVFLPFLGGGEVVRHLDARESHGLLRIKTVQTMWFGEVSGSVFPASDFEIDAAINAGNDVALIELEGSSGTAGITLGRLSIPQLAGVAPPLTLAGYGRTNAKDTIGELQLEVGVRNDLVAPSGAFLLRTATDHQTNGRICSGDSGGPIFLGDVQANVQNTLRLVAIASKTGLVFGGGNACAEGVQRFTRVDRSEVRNWICTRTGAGC